MGNGLGRVAGVKPLQDRLELSHVWLEGCRMFRATMTAFLAVVSCTHEYFAIKRISCSIGHRTSPCFFSAFMLLLAYQKAS